MSAILASGPSGTLPGGLVCVSAAGIEVIDRLPSRGLVLDGELVHRMLWDEHINSRVQIPLEVVTYDEVGVRATLRLDDVADPHDLAVVDDEILVVSTGTNEILAADSRGRVRIRAKFADADNAWHVNCLERTPDGRLLATAFGRRDAPSAWVQHPRDGVIFDVDTLEVLAADLHLPHHPRWTPDGLLVTASGDGTVLRLDDDGQPDGVAELNGFTRGLLLSDGLLLAGVSVRRHQAVGHRGADGGQIVALDPVTLRLVHSWDVPIAEVYDIAVVPDALVAGIRRGDLTSPARIAWAFGRPDRMVPAQVVQPGMPLEPAWIATALTTEIPMQLIASERADLTIVVENLGTSPLCSWPPHPVHIGYRWIDEQQRSSDVGRRAVLARPVAPGERVTVQLAVDAPESTGSYVLAIAPVQEDVRWFDDLAPANGARGAVEVVEAVDAT
jgi:Domain of unknown function (DUF4915)